MEMVLREVGSEVLTSTRPGREPSGAAIWYSAPEASFSRNASVGITSTLAFGRRPNSAGSLVYMPSM